MVDDGNQNQVILLVPPTLIFVHGSPDSFLRVGCMRLESRILFLVFLVFGESVVLELLFGALVDPFNPYFMHHLNFQFYYSST